MKKYTIKELNEKFEEILNENPQEMLEYELYHIDEEMLCELADLRQEDTNLPVIVWAGGPRNMKHGFRIKFQNSRSTKDDNSEMIPISISDNPQIPKSIHTKLRINQQELTEIKEWIKLNKETLLQYAKGEISTKQMIDRIKKI